MTADFAIVNGTLIGESATILRGNVLVKSGKIERITDSLSAIPAGITQIDATDNYVSPGFIDIHIHGTGGYDATRGDVESIIQMGKALVRFGITTFLPTSVSMPTQQIRSFLQAVKGSMTNPRAGAKIAGANLEGPFLNSSKRGVHREEYLQTPSLDAFKEIVQDYEPVVKIITIAPELKDGLELCRECVRLGIVAAMGHTNASFQQAMKGIDTGITHITHTFNAMSGLQGREPGAVGAALVSDDVKAEIIADGLHLNPYVALLAVRAKGPDGIILVSDSVMPTGTQLTEFDLCGTKGYVHDGGSFTEDGGLCGSLLTLDRAVRNLLSWGHLELPDVIRMTSLNAARQLDLGARTGSLVEGKDADIVLLDKNLNVVSTFVQGIQAYP